MFTIAEAIEVLSRTPAVLRAWLDGLGAEWLGATEGPETWSPFDVVGHLIHGNRTDWIPRARQLLAAQGDVPFAPFDRPAQFRDSRGKSLAELLDEFERLRRANLEELSGLGLTDAQLDMPGRHPALGPVTLRQLRATWVVHDLNHLGQIARVMARRCGDEVGCWKAYLPILTR
jgi:DinB superfamily